MMVGVGTARNSRADRPMAFSTTAQQNQQQQRPTGMSRNEPSDWHSSFGDLIMPSSSMEFGLPEDGDGSATDVSPSGPANEMEQSFSALARPSRGFDNNNNDKHTDLPKTRQAKRHPSFGELITPGRTFSTDLTKLAEVLEENNEKKNGADGDGGRTVMSTPTETFDGELSGGRTVMSNPSPPRIKKKSAAAVFDQFAEPSSGSRLQKGFDKSEKLRSNQQQQQPPSLGQKLGQDTAAASGADFIEEKSVMSWQSSDLKRNIMKEHTQLSSAQRMAKLRAEMNKKEENAAGTSMHRRSSHNGATSASPETAWSPPRVGGAPTSSHRRASMGPGSSHSTVSGSSSDRDVPFSRPRSFGNSNSFDAAVDNNDDNDMGYEPAVPDTDRQIEQKMDKYNNKSQDRRKGGRRELRHRSVGHGPRSFDEEEFRDTRSNSIVDDDDDDDDDPFAGFAGFQDDHDADWSHKRPAPRRRASIGGTASSSNNNGPVFAGGAARVPQQQQQQQQQHTSTRHHTMTPKRRISMGHGGSNNNADGQTKESSQRMRPVRRASLGHKSSSSSQPNSPARDMMGYGTAAPDSDNLMGYGTAVPDSDNAMGYGTAVPDSDNGMGYGTAVPDSDNGMGYGTAVPDSDKQQGSDGPGDGASAFANMDSAQLYRQFHKNQPKRRASIGSPTPSQPIADAADNKKLRPGPSAVAANRAISLSQHAREKALDLSSHGAPEIDTASFHKMDDDMIQRMAREKKLNERQGSQRLIGDDSASEASDIDGDSFAEDTDETEFEETEVGSTPENSHSEFDMADAQKELAMLDEQLTANKALTQSPESGEKEKKRKDKDKKKSKKEGEGDASKEKKKKKKKREGSEGEKKTKKTRGASVKPKKKKEPSKSDVDGEKTSSGSTLKKRSSRNNLQEMDDKDNNNNTEDNGTMRKRSSRVNLQAEDAGATSPDDKRKNLKKRHSHSKMQQQPDGDSVTITTTKSRRKLKPSPDSEPPSSPRKSKSTVKSTSGGNMAVAAAGTGMKKSKSTNALKEKGTPKDRRKSAKG